MPRDELAAARAVEAAMGERGWDVADMVRGIGVDPGTLRDFLNGQRWPRTSTRGKIERALGWESGTIRAIAEGVGQAPGARPARPADIAELLATDPTLSERSREHIVNQYRLLQQLSALELTPAEAREIDRDAIRQSKELSAEQKRQALEAEEEARGGRPAASPPSDRDVPSSQSG